MGGGFQSELSVPHISLGLSLSDSKHGQASNVEISSRFLSHGHPGVADQEKYTVNNGIGVGRHAPLVWAHACCTKYSSDSTINRDGFYQ
jgi:hypothetical protein